MYTIKGEKKNRKQYRHTKRETLTTTELRLGEKRETILATLFWICHLSHPARFSLDSSGGPGKEGGVMNEE